MTINLTHTDDAAVDRFAASMKAKLRRARAKGYDGWDDPGTCTVEFLASMLIKHLGKENAGNFEDVANFAMMLHQRGADPKVLADAAAEPIRQAVGKALALGVAALGSTQAAPEAEPVALSVWYGPMPESNGKSNYTAILHRKGVSLLHGCIITLDRSEYPDRVRYEADRARFLLGELDEEPCILDYDPDAHSGYTEPQHDAELVGLLRGLSQRISKVWIGHAHIDDLILIQRELDALSGGGRFDTVAGGGIR